MTSFLDFYLRRMVAPEHVERVRAVLATDAERAKALAPKALLDALERTAPEPATFDALASPARLQAMLLYFGCIKQVGHRLWSRGPEPMPWIRSAPIDAQPWGKAIDGGLCPGVRELDGRTVTPEHQIEGVSRLVHDHGWTALAFWDRSVDDRPGSCSVWVAEGMHSAEAMIAAARAGYPTVWARYSFPVVVEP
jgi:hypothetical protein